MRLCSCSHASKGDRKTYTGQGRTKCLGSLMCYGSPFSHPPICCSLSLFDLGHGTGHLLGKFRGHKTLISSRLALFILTEMASVSSELLQGHCSPPNFHRQHHTSVWTVTSDTRSQSWEESSRVVHEDFETGITVGAGDVTKTYRAVTCLCYRWSWLKGVKSWGAGKKATEENYVERCFQAGQGNQSPVLRGVDNFGDNIVIQ